MVTICLSQVITAQVAAPKLRCIRTLSNGDVELVWQWLPGNCGPVHIYASTNKNGPYSQIAIVPFPNTSYVHTGAGGNTQTWFYYLTDDPSCGSPLLTSDTLDNLQPSAPRMIVASVHTKDSVLIRWKHSPDPERFWYIVYVYDRLSGNYIPLDTVPATDTQWWHTTFHPLRPHEANLHPEVYTVATADSCGNVGPLQENTHATVFLDGKWIVCPGYVELRWTRYRGWEPDRHIVEVAFSSAGFSWTPVDTLSGTDTVWRYVPEVNDSVCFRVEACSLSICARSNIYCTGVISRGEPDSLYILRVSVNNINSVLVEWVIDTPFAGKYFRLWKDAVSPKGARYNLGAVRYEPGRRIYSFVDSPVDVEETVYKYWVDVVDTCGEVYSSSNYGTNIVLRGRGFESGINLLWWNGYESWITACSLRIVRVWIQDAGLRWDISLSCADTMYEHEVSDIVTQSGKFCYQICEYGEGDLYSCSNWLCIAQPIIVQMPSVFMPVSDGVIKPVIRYEGRVERYSYVIINRWGEVVFSTTDPDMGWNGNYRGKPASQGTYMYQIEIEAEGGERYSRKGYFYLAYP